MRIIFLAKDTTSPDSLVVAFTSNSGTDSIILPRSLDHISYSEEIDRVSADCADSASQLPTGRPRSSTLSLRIGGLDRKVARPQSLQTRIYESLALLAERSGSA